VWPALRLPRPALSNGRTTAGSAPNLVRNPDFANARPVPPRPLRGSGVPGESAAEDWTLWNNLDATTSTSLEHTTRAGDSGQMLHITTTASSCGLLQQWAPSDTGPDAGVASVWVYVIRGTVIMGCGDGGNIGIDATSTSQGRTLTWSTRYSAPSGWLA
jgi:hypothetical protein